MSLKGGRSQLFPVRVDVKNEHAAIVETLLLDPSCLPVPLYAPLEHSIERNVEQLTYTLLSDMEVHGMGRTARHFTGRADLWNKSLQELVADQLRQQLWEIVVNNPCLAPNEATTKSSSQDTTVSTSQETKKSPNIKKIRIRLNSNGIVIQDDFDWDLTVPLCPLALAKSMAKDLNLTDEAVIAIATTIIEQIHGVPLDETADKTDTFTKKSPCTAAWLLEHRDDDLTHLVDQYRNA